MKNLFINSSTGLFRAGWRISFYILIFAFINLILMTGTRFILGSLKGGGTLWFILLGISATAAAYLVTKYFNKEIFSSLGLRLNKKSILDVFAGILTSALIMAALYFTMLQTGLIQFNGFSSWSETITDNFQFSTAAVLVLLTVLLKFIIVAWQEELSFRGVLLQNIMAGLGAKWAIVISTVAFGLVHVANPNATLLSTIIIILITLQLVYAYFKTGQLWLSIGLHLGWNFFQASVFGFPSSGQASPSLLSQTPIGPDWLSGGEFGAEGSVLIIPFTLASLFLIQWWVGFTRNKENRKFLSSLVGVPQKNNLHKRDISN